MFVSTRSPRSALLLAALALSAGACTVEKGGDADTAGTTTAAAPAPATPAPAMPADSLAPDTTAADLRIEVDVTARRVRAIRAGQTAAEYGVAVGSAEWPTRTGEWTIGQVVWNPEWTPPPDESWAKDEKPKQPGAPDNPLGRVQLVYDPPRTIHGTNDPASIGKAVSHGSIRMRNEEAAALAKLVMEAGGAVKDSAWFRQAQQNRKEKQVVDLPKRVPIRVY